MEKVRGTGGVGTAHSHITLPEKLVQKNIFRSQILGCPVDIVSREEAVAALCEHIDAYQTGEGNDFFLVVTLNPEMVMRSCKDRQFHYVVEKAALIIPDGIGVVRALHRRGYEHIGRIPGVDYMNEYFRLAEKRKHRIALIGGIHGVAHDAAVALQAEYPLLRIVLADDGDPTRETAEKLASVRPDVVCAAYGAGKQEQFLWKYRKIIGAAAGIGIGGSLDYWSGNIKRAPLPIQTLDLEWAWRLAREPRRLRRQWVLPQFWLQEKIEYARQYEKNMK